MLQLHSPSAPKIVLVSGPAGIGKTTLVKTLQAESMVDNAVFNGRCLPLGQFGLPYAPVADAIRSVVDAQPVPVVLESFPELVSALLPERAEAQPVGESAGGPGESEWHRSRLFGQISRFLSEMSSGRQLIVTIEDLHWADAGTLAWLSYFVRTFRSHELLLILTFRDDEVSMPLAVHQFLAETSRLSNMARVRMSGLSVEEVAAIASALLGATINVADAERLYRRSDGNPFYVEQLCRAAVRGAADTAMFPSALPEDLVELLAARIRTLPDGAKHVFNVIAVDGQSVDEDLLADVCGLTAELLQVHVNALLNARLLSASADDRYSVGHALLAEVAIARLNRSERRDIHRRLADHLIKQSGRGRRGARETSAAEIALHCKEALEQERTLIWSLKAAKEAEARFAEAAAAQHYKHAIDAWHEPGASDCISADMDVAELYLRSAQSRIRIDDWSLAIEYGLEALNLLNVPTDSVRVLRAWRLLFLAYVYTGESAAAAHACDSIVRAATLTPDDTASAQVIANCAYTLHSASYPAAEVLAQRVLTMAGVGGDPMVVIPALSIRGERRMLTGDVEGGSGDYERALAISQSPYSRLTAGVFVDYSNTLQLVAQYDKAAATAMRGWEISKQVGASDQALAHFNLINAAEALLASDCLPEADETIALLASVSTYPHVLMTNRVLAAQLELKRGDSAGALLALGPEVSGVGFTVMRADREIRAEVAIIQRDWDLACTAVDDVLATEETGTEVNRTGWLLCLGLRAEADRAVDGRRRRDNGTVEKAGNAARRLTEWAARLDPSPLSPTASGIGPAVSVLWQAEYSRMQGASEPRLWKIVADEWRRISCPLRAVYAEYRFAEASLAVARTDSAVQSLRDAFETAARLGAAHMMNDINALASRARIRLGSGQPEPAAQTTPFDLTRREAQVLRLIADGMTNVEIGQELMISPKTVELHVSRTFSKLGVRGRVQAARVALSSGFFEATES